jgi:chemotaxis protein methyltransferase CheR
VRQHTGIALADNKRQLVYSRLSRRLRQLKLRNFTEYCDLLAIAEAPELEEFINAITTNLTSYFREDHHFQFLAQAALPDALQRNAASRRLRIWSAGCSTGQEPYSIAIVLREALQRVQDWDVRILATDLDSNAVATAKAGRYTEEQMAGVSPGRRDQWFTEVGGERGQFQVTPALTSLITFKQLNLMHEWPMRGPFDVIFCRNVVIYFDKPTQRDLFERMAALQMPGAHLFIGHSENLFNLTQRYRLLAKTTYERAEAGT